MAITSNTEPSKLHFLAFLLFPFGETFLAGGPFFLAEGVPCAAFAKVRAGRQAEGWEQRKTTPGQISNKARVVGAAYHLLGFSGELKDRWTGERMSIKQLGPCSW